MEHFISVFNYCSTFFTTFTDFSKCTIFQPIEPMQVDVAPEVDQQAAEDNFIIEAATIVRTFNIYLMAFLHNKFDLVQFIVHHCFIVFLNLPAKVIAT